MTKTDKDMETVSRIINKLRIAWARGSWRDLGRFLTEIGRIQRSHHADKNIEQLANDELEKILDDKIDEIIKNDADDVCTSCGKQMERFSHYITGEVIGVKYCEKCWTLFKDESGGGYNYKKDRVEVFDFHHIYGKMNSKGKRDILIDDFGETEGFTDGDHLPIRKINGEWCYILY